MAKYSRRRGKRRQRFACGFAGLALLALAGCAAPSKPREGGDPVAGYGYAVANCAGCHSVEAGAGRSPNPAAPAFQDLSDRPDMNRMTLTALLNSPHRDMPSLIVPRDRVADVAAYLESL